MDIENQSLAELFKLASRVGNKRYHKLTAADFEDYRKFDYWRYINGDGECGSTLESKAWVQAHSDWHCPICEVKYQPNNGRSIDHKLPRAQYPWLSLEFKNLWVICQMCNEEKGDMHWYEYEHYMFTRHPKFYPAVKAARPVEVLKSLKLT
jgi:5-methylcytosine-specific restriction endonuclease McrA